MLRTIYSSDTKDIARTLQRILGRPPEHPPDEPADMLGHKLFHYLWEGKIIPNLYLHHFKTNFKHTSSSQFATEAQIAENQRFSKETIAFLGKAPESAQRATKT